MGWQSRRRVPEYFICFVLLFISGDQTQGLAHPTLNTLGFSENRFHCIAQDGLTLCDSPASDCLDYKHVPSFLTGLCLN